MTMIDTRIRPPAWALLERALIERTPVQVRYHGHQRVLCPHALGWKHGRPKMLAYQTGGTTSHGPLPDNPHQRWRSMFVDEIEDPVITDGLWQSANNHSPNSNCIDDLEIAISIAPRL
jgi:hypothetical protein